MPAPLAIAWLRGTAFRIRRKGVHALAVTEGLVLGGVKLTIAGVDGGEFDLPAFTLKLLANTAATGSGIPPFATKIE